MSQIPEHLVSHINRAFGITETGNVQRCSFIEPHQTNYGLMLDDMAQKGLLRVIHQMQHQSAYGITAAGFALFGITCERCGRNSSSGPPTELCGLDD